MSNFLTQIKSNLVTAIITTLVAIVTLFSDKIVGDIKFELNKADLRVSSYEKFTASISTFVFNAENVAGFYQNGTTTKTSLHLVVDPYNTSIDDIRKQEYITYGILTRFWTKDDIGRFEKMMETVKRIDLQIHALNPEAELIENGKEDHADPKITAPIVKQLNALNRELEIRVKTFIEALV